MHKFRLEHGPLSTLCPCTNKFTDAENSFSSKFPFFRFRMTDHETTARSWSLASLRRLSQIRIKATKANSFNIKFKDYWSCHITGIAITKGKRRLLVDNANRKVKVFSPDMEFFSSISVTDGPWDIAVVNDGTAIVTTNNKKLVILDISERQLSISRTVKLHYDVHGISICKDKLVVTCPNSEPPSVKMIDQTGRVYWSTYADQQGRQLFRNQFYVCCHDDDGTLTVLVTDLDTGTLTLLKGETGDVVTTRQLLARAGHRGVTTDTAGNVYACNRMENKVSVLLGGLAEERILLTKRDGLNEYPQAIVYDETTRQLIVSYIGDDIHYFQLS